MEVWWQGLNLELQIFYGIGILALAVLVLQLVLMLFGGLDDSIDIDVEAAEHGSGLGIFSVRGITAFFVGFGWTGVIALKGGLSLGLSIFLAFLAGTLLMVLIFLLMRSMMRLQSSGTLNYNNAVGEVGTVYVTVPAGQRSGGQIEVMIQGRHLVVEVLQKGETPLPPGSKVRVTDLVGRSTLVVEPLSV